SSSNLYSPALVSAGRFLAVPRRSIKCRRATRPLAADSVARDKGLAVISGRWEGDLSVLSCRHIQAVRPCTEATQTALYILCFGRRTPRQLARRYCWRFPHD